MEIIADEVLHLGEKLEIGKLQFLRPNWDLKGADLRDIVALRNWLCSLCFLGG